MVSQTPTEYGLRPNTLTIPELEQSKAAVLNTLASVHSRRSYTFAIDRFIAWYCSEPRLTFNRAVVVRYRSHLEGLSLSASTINSHLSAIRKLADQDGDKNVESSSFSPRKTFRNSTPASVSGLYSAGKSGVFTRVSPGLTSRLPAPPTTSSRGTFAALVAAMIFEAFVLRNFTLCITTSCPASTAASAFSFCTSPETGLTEACP